MKKQVIIGAVIFSLCVAGCSVLKPEPQQIDLNDYLSYEISGYDGEGRIEYSIDLEGVLDDYENLEECNLSKFVILFRVPGLITMIFQTAMKSDLYGLCIHQLLRKNTT